jgi:peptidoglycan/LPS O-acetylase OafA/YrhL
MPLEPSPRGTLDLLLIIRGLAALSVVVWHVEGYKAQLPTVLNTSGRMAVWVFFGISGYVIAYGFLERGRYRLTFADLKYFYLNRFLRIYPLFLGLSVLAWATQWLTTGLNPIGWRDLPGQLLALQWNQAYTLVGVFWTLGIELQFYLLAPLLVVPLLLRGRAAIVGGLVAYACAACWYQYAAISLGWSWDGRNIISNLPHFLAGMVACRFVLMIHPPPRVWLGMLSLGCAAGVLCRTNWIYHRLPGVFWSINGVLLADAIIVLLVLAHASVAARERPRRVAFDVFAFLGTVSYGIYAWHGLLATYLPWSGKHLATLIALSIGAAYLSYRLIERPALALRRHPIHRAGADPARLQTGP